jgi:Holliday junction resolvasome RuvABC DNA-binding subunit
MVEKVDIKALQKTPWVWPKTARRLIVELQQSMSKASIKKMQNAWTPEAKQLQKYLEWLGYTKPAVESALQSYPEKITKKNSKTVLAHILSSL